jgi:hypothetical protein
MFAKAFVTLLSVASVLVSGVSAGPIARSSNTVLRRDQSPNSQFSLNNWGGFSSLQGFDDFYGYNNFGGFHNQQVVVDRLVCHQEKIEIVQQRLAVLREIMKRVVVQTVCEVESEVILLQQHESAFKDFYSDIFRSRGRQVGFDRDVVSHWNKFFNGDGSLNVDDWGFKGSDIGRNFVEVDGFNWDSSISPSRTRDARLAALNAEGFGSI